MQEIKFKTYYSLAMMYKKFANINFLNKKESWMARFKCYMEKIYELKHGKRKPMPQILKEQKTFENFCSINSEFWEEKPFKEDAPTILVEGLFAEAGPNYVMRIGMIAKTIEKIKDVNLLVILRRSIKREPLKAKVWQSFKMNNFISIYEDIFFKFSIFKKLKIDFLTEIYYWWSKILLMTGQNQKFSQLSFQGVRVGDILYDEIIKVTPIGEYTIKEISPTYKHFFKRLFIYFFVSEYLYEKYKPKYYISTHTQYISYGMHCRYFANKGTVIIETTDDMLFIHDDFSLNPPKYHNILNNLIKENINNLYNNDEMHEKIKEELNNRFHGKAEQIDARMAYMNKKDYSKDTLKERLGIKNDNPTVFIFAHVMADAPQGLSDGALFVDYYQWIVETIKFAGKIDDINWIVKPHPSSKTYGEVGEVEKMVKELCPENSSVYVCPDDFNTAGVLDAAHAILTVQGTVGLEFSCMGIPIVITGKPFYSGFGFTIEPQSVEEYFNILRTIKELKPLDDNKIRMARAVYGGFFERTNKDFSLIDTTLKDMTWGCACEKDVLGAFDLMSKRLQKIDPRGRESVIQIERYFSKEKQEESAS